MRCRRASGSKRPRLGRIGFGAGEGREADGFVGRTGFRRPAARAALRAAEMADFDLDQQVGGHMLDGLEAADRRDRTECGFWHIRSVMSKNPPGSAGLFAGERDQRQIERAVAPQANPSSPDLPGRGVGKLRNARDEAFCRRSTARFGSGRRHRRQLRRFRSRHRFSRRTSRTIGDLAMRDIGRSAAEHRMAVR